MDLYESDVRSLAYPLGILKTSISIHSFIHIRLLSVVKTEPNMN